MSDDLKGKRALVTGSGKRSGIGYAIIEKLASRGADVIVADLGNYAAGDEDVKTGTREEMDPLAPRNPPFSAPPDHSCRQTDQGEDAHAIPCGIQGRRGVDEGESSARRHDPGEEAGACLLRGTPDAPLAE